MDVWFSASMHAISGHSWNEEPSWLREQGTYSMAPYSGSGLGFIL